MPSIESLLSSLPSWVGVMQKWPILFVFILGLGIGYWWGQERMTDLDVEEFMEGAFSTAMVSTITETRKIDLLYMAVGYRSMMMNTDCSVDKELLIALDQIPLAFGPDPNVLTALANLGSSSVSRGEVYRSLIVAMAQAVGLEAPPLVPSVSTISCD